MNKAMRERFFAAYAQLSQSEKALLDYFARRCMPGTSYSCPDEVINEAIVRICDGKRNWPPGVDLAVFMAGCIRSICHNGRTLKDSGHACLDDLVDAPALLIAMSAEDVALERERAAITKKAAAFARATLKSDAEGLQVLEGMVEGLEPKEMKEAFGIGDDAFRAARQRVVNRLKVYGQRHPL